MTNVLLDDLFSWAEVESKNPEHIPSLGVHLTKYILRPVAVIGEASLEVVEGTGVGTLGFHPQGLVPVGGKLVPANFAGAMTYKQVGGKTEVLTVQISPPAPPEPHPPVLPPPPAGSYTVRFVPEPGQPSLLAGGPYALVCSPLTASGTLSGVETATDGVVMHLQAELLPPPLHPLPAP